MFCCAPQASDYRADASDVGPSHQVAPVPRNRGLSWTDPRLTLPKDQIYTMIAQRRKMAQEDHAFCST